MNISTVTVHDNLEAICEQMQPDLWAADNDMSSYQPEKLKNFLEAGHRHHAGKRV